MTLNDAPTLYRALLARDARFDGRFFIGVTSTGIYCRPVCRVRTPRAENCRFFDLAALAEKAGFRPCLRCRPELAPSAQAWTIQDASSQLARQAARLLDAVDGWPEGGPTVAWLATRMGVSERHLRRIFEATLGVSPLQYLQTRRLLTAKQLLTDTALPMTTVAQASGFGSLRRFNAAFLAHYRMAPGALRRDVGQQAVPTALRLGYRPPLDVTALLAFHRQRAIAGVDWVSDDAGPERPVHLVRSLRLGGTLGSGWIAVRFDTERCAVHLAVSESLCAALPGVIAKVRQWLDLDADPAPINAVLHADFPQGDGLRVPGTVDGFELAVRAILGQQVTVAAARTLARRVVERFGEALPQPWTHGQAVVDRLFPTAAVLASASGESLGELGIVRQRQAAIVALSHAVATGQIDLSPHADVTATMDALRALPGIGDWTAQYVAMRALRWPDAWPAGDVALQKALGVGTARAALAASSAWQPWRSYAVLRAWQRLSPQLPSHPPGP